MRELHFSDFRIDLEAMSLFREEEQIAIGRKTLDALLFLIENRNRIVPHETLRRSIWRSVKISPSTIPMCILEIRKALNEDVRSPRILVSKKGRGYRFIADVTFHIDPTAASTTPSELPFIGRKAALDALLSITRSTVTHLQGTLATITGEAGSGKSRLVTEFIHLASHRLDFIVAKTTSKDQDSAFSIWTQALRAALERFPENLELAECADRISSYIPELLTHPSRPTPPSKIDRSGFLTQWLNAFKSIPRSRPLLVVLEDIHQADDDSILLLEHMATEITRSPLFLLVTTRPSLTTRDNLPALGRIMGSADITSIQLVPFSTDEVESLIPAFHPDRHEAALNIMRQTAGNPFYVTHLIRLWGSALNTNNSQPARSHLTETASEIVGRQLSDLPTPTKLVLQAASVVGARFKLPLVAASLGITASEALELLESARAARLIEAVESDIFFCHSILRDLLYQSIDRRTRCELHAAIAANLEAQIDGREKSTPAVFHHLRNAFPAVSIERVRAAGLAAGIDSISRFAYHEAARILNAALDLSSQGQAAESTTHLDLMITLSNATLYSGDRQRAKEILIDAARLARRFGLTEHLAQCALSMAPDFLSIEVGTYDPDIVMILKESLERLPAESLALRARVLARLSQMTIWSGSIEHEIEAMTQSALTAAQLSGDPRALVAALAARADASHGPDRIDERIQRTLELQEATLAQSDTYSFLLQQTRLIAALLEKGEIRRVSIENDRYRKVAKETGLPQYLWYPVSTDSMLACLHGDLDLADQFAAQYRELAGSAPDENFTQTFACQYALRKIERGESNAILPLTKEFAGRQRSVFSWAAATAWIQWDCGQDEAARESLRQFTESDIRKLFFEPGGTIGLAALAETTAYLGDRSRANFLFDLIVPVADTFATAGYGVAYFGCMARYASVLATALGRAKDAIHLGSIAVKREARIKSKSWTIYAMLDMLRAKQGRLNIKRPQSDHEFKYFKKFGLDSLPRANRCVRKAFSFES